MAFASNIAAMNAAKKFMKSAGFDAAAYKDYFKIEKIDGEWHAMQIQEFPAPRDPLSCLLIEREGAWAFPMASEAAQQALTNEKEQLKAAKAFDEGDHDPDAEAAEFLAQQAQADEQSFTMDEDDYQLEADEPSAQDEAEEDEAQANRQKAADALADALQSESSLPNGKVWIHISSVAKPTKFVWHVADEMVAAAIAAGKPAPSRKEVQDECIRRGVASGTARTQYQAWKKASDETRKNATKAAELSARFNQKL